MLKGQRKYDEGKYYKAITHDLMFGAPYFTPPILPSISLLYPHPLPTLLFLTPVVIVILHMYYKNNVR